jgi:hypothetical protein
MCGRQCVGVSVGRMQANVCGCGNAAAKESTPPPPPPSGHVHVGCTQTVAGGQLVICGGGPQCVGVCVCVTQIVAGGQPVGSGGQCVGECVCVMQIVAGLCVGGSAAAAKS